MSGPQLSETEEKKPMLTDPSVKIAHIIRLGDGETLAQDDDGNFYLVKPSSRPVTARNLHRNYEVTS